MRFTERMCGNLRRSRVQAGHTPEDHMNALPIISAVMSTALTFFALGALFAVEIIYMIGA